MMRNKSVSVHEFAMVPRADIPRSSFRMQHNLKTTFDAGFLVPIFCEEGLPGDVFNVTANLVGRLATPIFPIMDNLHLETFFFAVPMRLLWTHFRQMMGQQTNPGDTIAFTVPQVVSPGGGFAVGEIYDHFGLPTAGQVGVGNTISVNVLPLRAYNLIYDEWFRDENLQNSISQSFGDGPDTLSWYALKRRGKRHDYFTSCLPWPQKATTGVSIPLGTTAPVIPANAAGSVPTFRRGAGLDTGRALQMSNANTNATWFAAPTAIGAAQWDVPGLVADLSTATAATINQLRQSFQIQRLLERDARGGTRYTEVIRAHFGVVSPDARQQRPEYIGGGHSFISVNPVAQTSNTPVSGTPQGNLAAFGTVHGLHGFSCSLTEHCYIIGLACVRADLTYQQGLRRMWSKRTRYDFHWPVFSFLGEQAVLNKEIYCDGSANDDLVFGYQERGAEYRYKPSEIHGLFRSTSAGTIDPWHLAQRFGAVPTLNDAFISETPPLARVLAVGSGANGQQLILDGFFDIKAARPMPMYGVPGNIDRF